MEGREVMRKGIEGGKEGKGGVLILPPKNF
jgi:hypothetical protein